MSCIYNFMPKFSPHGRNIIFIAILATLFISIFSPSIGFIAALISSFCLYFFRDPDRKCFQKNGLIISSADGLITFIGEVEVPEKFGSFGEMTKISIFLNVFDIHVNRLPVNGVIKDIIYSAGKFISATNDKESDDNECNTLIIEDELGNNVLVSQIAGLIARRIICTVRKNEKSIIGERFGIIKFGSRVNIYIPKSFRLLVNLGQRVIGGETIIAARDFKVLENISLKSESELD
jgi:phosphatidylserine decarboxylase